jgi:bifunctional ADP-heptose synthase (sugar kinase/adenylyltransferase)
VGYDIVKDKGGEIITIHFMEGYSTSSIIEKIKKL